MIICQNTRGSGQGQMVVSLSDPSRWLDVRLFHDALCIKY